MQIFESRVDAFQLVSSVCKCKWALHVIYTIEKGVKRPGELIRTADGLTAKVLNERLTKLMNYGIIEKTSYPEVPPRVEYNLTSRGQKFIPLLSEIERLQREINAEDDERQT